VNQSMLESVVAGDWSTYASHCSNDLSCFEAETNGILAEGLNFHRFYFELPAPPAPAVRPPCRSPWPAPTSAGSARTPWC
jgi:hypothetical protein